MQQQPVFLVSSTRSGSTMLRLMLNGHPDVSFQYELNQVFLYLQEDGSEPSLSSFCASLKKDWNHQRFVEDGFQLESCEAYRQAVEQILFWKQVRDEKPIVGATFHKKGFSRAALFWPEARFIHLIRDGRDVAPSACALSTGGNAFVAADGWLCALNDWEIVKSRIRQDQWIQVRFEDLVRNTNETLELICNFLQIPFSNKLYSYAETSTYSLPDSSAAERWRKLPREKVWLLERKIGTKLVEYGYPISAPKPAGKILRLALWLDDKVRSALVRIRRYGFGLYLQRQLVKVIRFRSYRERVIGQMERIDLSFRK